MANAQTVSANPGQVTLAVENPAAPDAGLTRPDDPVGSVPAGTTGEETTEESPAADTGAPTSDTGEPSADDTTEATTTEQPAPPPATPNRPAVTEEDQVLTLVNAARAQHGCAPVTSDPRLARAAEDHSSDMSGRSYFDHTTPEGVGFAERIVAAGYPSPGAENIARGQTSATQVMNSWMESAGHRANILNCQLTRLGVGLDKDGYYWTQNFGY